MIDKLKSKIWEEEGKNLSDCMSLKDLRKINLEDHQKIIDEYCLVSKSKMKFRNIQIYDYVVLQKHTMIESNKKYNISGTADIINKIKYQGFHKDLLSYFSDEQIEWIAGKQKRTEEYLSQSYHMRNAFRDILISDLRGEEGIELDSDNNIISLSWNND